MKTVEEYNFPDAYDSSHSTESIKILGELILDCTKEICNKIDESNCQSWETGPR